MELDYTKLDSLALTGLDTTQEPARANQEAGNRGRQGEGSAQERPALNELRTGLKKLQGEANQTGDALEQARSVYQTYQRNIRLSEALQRDITKGLNQGADIYSLFLKAAEAISFMTSNNVFYEHAEANLRAVYGVGLREPQALNLAIQQAEERLERLQEAEQRRPEGEALERIRRAIKANREQIERLQE
jgi:hypothetical protein